MSQNKRSTLSKGAIRKSFVRNTEVPLNKVKSQVVNHSKVEEKPEARPSVKNRLRFDLSGSGATQSKENKYKCPALNTTLEVAKTIQRIEKVKPVKFQTTGDLTPVSKGMVAQQVTKQMNFRPEQVVFKNLVPINVNDSILIPEVRKPFRKKYVPKSSKDPVPELSDFLKPIEPLKLVLPPCTKIEPLKMQKANVFDSVYELHLNFHPDEMP